MMSPLGNLSETTKHTTTMMLAALAAAFLPPVPGAINPAVTQANIAATIWIAAYRQRIGMPHG